MFVANAPWYVVLEIKRAYSGEQFESSEFDSRNYGFALQIVEEINIYNNNVYYTVNFEKVEVDFS